MIVVPSVLANAMMIRIPRSSGSDRSSKARRDHHRRIASRTRGNSEYIEAHWTIRPTLMKCLDFALFFSRIPVRCPTLIPASMLPQQESVDFVPALEALSGRIRENSSKLSWYVQSQDHLDASLYGSGTIPKSPRHRDAQGWRHRLKQDALDLFRLASGPEEYIANLSINVSYTTCCNCRVPD